MNGTSFSAVAAMDLMPPTITMNTTPAMTRPTSQPSPSSAPPATLLICA